MPSILQFFAQKKDDVILTAAFAQFTTLACNSQFKVVHNKHNLTLLNSEHPAGWVNPTTEREDATIRTRTGDLKRKFLIKK